MQTAQQPALPEPTKREERRPWVQGVWKEYCTSALALAATLCALAGAFNAPLTHAGEVNWKQTYPIPPRMLFQARKVIGTQDGGYAFVADGIVLYKLSESGELQWQAEIRSAPGTPGNRNVANDILQTADGGLLVIGGSDSDSIAGRDLSRPFGDRSGSSRDAVPLVAKFSPQGKELWRRVLLKPRPDYKIGEADQAVEISDGYLVLGRHQFVREKKPGLPVPRREVFLTKLSPAGEVLWERSFGDIPYLGPIGYRLTKLEGDRIAMTGYAVLSPPPRPDGSPDLTGRSRRYSLFLAMDTQGNETKRYTLDGLFQASAAMGSNVFILMNEAVRETARNAAPFRGPFILGEIDSNFAKREYPVCQGISDVMILGMVAEKSPAILLAFGRISKPTAQSFPRPYPVLMEVRPNGDCRIRREDSDLDVELRSLVPASDSSGWIALFAHLAKRDVFWLEKFRLE